MTAVPTDRTEEYLARDLHAEGIWESTTNPRYGMTVFNAEGELLLREPTNHFDGYVWTFPKGRPDAGEHSAVAALRETLEETGHRPAIVGHLPEAFRGSSTSSVNFYYLGYDTRGEVDQAAMERNRETHKVLWVDEAAARRLIEQTTNTKGRARDLATMAAAFAAWAELEVH